MRMDRRKSGFRMRELSDDFSPMEGVGNMADAMLVFACGLLLALIISWNVDVSETGTITKTPDTRYEVESIGDSVEEDADVTENLKDMGRVYQDPQTGKYYVVEE